MYFRCATLPSNNYVWIPKTCPIGLVYDADLKACALPGEKKKINFQSKKKARMKKYNYISGDNWECQLDDNEKSSNASAEDENVYGVNNLNYLKDQIKGYESDQKRKESEEEEEEENVNFGSENEQEENVEHLSDDGFLITLTPGQGKNQSETMEGSDSSDSIVLSTNNSIGNEFESSGDGDDNEHQLENKAAYASIPFNTDANSVVTSQLQRLAQLIKKVHNNQQDSENNLAPDDLNQYLALHKITYDHENNYLSTAEPVPHNGIIDDKRLEQILDLQKKINKLAHNRDTYSTAPTPVRLAITGNGAYPAAATTVHIKATNTMKNPKFPNDGYTSSQIVVNRPGGAVIFTMPNSQMKKPDQEKPGSQVSEETLKLLLELTKQMVNQAPSTPNFVHQPAPTNGFGQSVIRPIFYTVPYNDDSLSSILSMLDAKKGMLYSDKQNQSMEKIAAVSGTVPTTSNEISEPDDKGQSTIIHNHIPITIANPSPTSSIVNRIHSVSTTMRPNVFDQYDSYGQPLPSESSHSINHISYPPYPDTADKHSINYYRKPSPSVSTSVSSSSYPSAFSAPNYNQNIEQQPQYIQISQSRPHESPYISSYPNNNAIVNNAQRPVHAIPTFASIDGGNTQKFYTPSPHLNDNNVNDFVTVDRKPYPTLRPINYVQVGASNPTSNYADPPAYTYGHQSHKYAISNKVDRFDNVAESSDNYEDEQSPIQNTIDYSESNESDDHSNSNNDENPKTNLDQHQNDQTDGNVMNLLAQYNSNPKPKLPNRIIHQLSPVSNEKHKQFVNLNGNFMSLETYQQTIEPYLPSDSLLGSKIEIITCASGVRQANSSDCTRYFVCNVKTGKILSYACPLYTAFNPDTRMCTAETYARCYPMDDMKTIIMGSNKYTKQQIQQQLIETNRIKTEAMKSQHLAHLISLETDKILKSASNKYNKGNRITNIGKATSMPLTPTRSSNQAVVTNRPLRRQQQKVTANRATAKPTQAPTRKTHPIKPSNPTNAKRPQGKRRVPCKKEGKLADNLSNVHYFLCFKDPQRGNMRARRLHCPAQLIFCPTSLICTQMERCMNKFNRM